jgi:micrococcal nuclease
VIGARRAPGAAAAALLVVGLVLLLSRNDDGSQDDSSSTVASRSRTLEAKVVRAVDGDTIEVATPDGTEDVRYIGVDTPESVKPGTPVQCYAKRASHFNDRLVTGRAVRLRFDRERRDVYGRLLAYVYADGRFVNAELVRRGLARTLTIPPNTSHAGLFDRLASRAGRAGRGLWGAC